MRCTRLFPVLLLSVAVAIPANAANVLFIGAQPDAAGGDDLAVLEYLEDVLMHQVDYLVAAESDPDDAIGIDLLVISSTLGSGDARGKFQDAEVPILQWEEALMRWDHGNPDGNFRTSEFSRNGDGYTTTDIEIRDDAVGHPLAAGLAAGVHTISTDEHRTPMSFGELAPGAIPIANLDPEVVDNGADDRILDDATIFTNSEGVSVESAPVVLMAVDKGAELGPAGDGFFAPDKRVHFPIEDVGFSFLNETGLALWDASIDWLLGNSTGEPGDFNSDGVLDGLDLDAMVPGLAGNDLAFDLNADGQTDFDDRLFWLKSLRGTWVGDSNLDGEFSSTDFVQVFQAGLFENPEAPATWGEGDWNGDGLFNSGDFVAAFQDGGFENGPLPAAVPEPSSIILMLLGSLALLRRNRS